MILSYRIGHNRARLGEAGSRTASNSPGKQLSPLQGQEHEAL